MDFAGGFDPLPPTVHLRRNIFGSGRWPPLVFHKKRHQNTKATRYGVAFFV